jgi:hypothetical protein
MPPVIYPPSLVLVIQKSEVFEESPKHRCMSIVEDWAKRILVNEVIIRATIKDLIMVKAKNKNVVILTNVRVQ